MKLVFNLNSVERQIQKRRAGTMFLGFLRKKVVPISFIRFIKSIGGNPTFQLSAEKQNVNTYILLRRYYSQTVCLLHMILLENECFYLHLCV